MDKIESALSTYSREVSRLSSSPTTTEATYYPAIKTLLEAVVSHIGLRLDVRASTSEVRLGGGVDAPDFAIYDGAGDFVMLFVEAKLPETDIRDLALSQDRNDQIGRYLASTGAVLLSTAREFAVVTVADSRRGTRPVVPENRRISAIVSLWSSHNALSRGEPIPSERGDELADLVEETLTRHTPIASPETLARVLARQARRASVAMPAQFTAAVRSLQEDFGAALGITFEGEEGEHFFRSSLVQTVYYSLFAGWLLHASEWRVVANDGFDWKRTGEYLRIPFLAGLFHEIQNPIRLRELGLRTHLEIAAATLERVDKGEFFRRLRPTVSDVDDDEGFSSAIVYFYEPFLAAFDPRLREDLGVWYTPPAIVRYQVHQIDRLLREQLGCERGLADDDVIVLDPACGTGAYLIETLRCIAETLQAEGVGPELAATLRKALETRIVGFEILTAPFVVAHLQLYLLLARLGAPPDEAHRAGVYLTNALTGWREAEQVPLHFPELQQEHDAAQRVKRSARIVVVIGNPPYNRFAGIPMAEEQDLVDPYKGIHRDDRGRQVGQSDLWAHWGVRKQLLDDLYVRFFRLAEECIGVRAQFGIVSYISNNSFLTGRSHPIMRESLLTSFDAVWIDNLHGNRLASERTPWGGSCETVFSTSPESAGIKVGTCVTTWLKRLDHVTDPAATLIYSRDFWGSAAAKREALDESAKMEDWSEAERLQASERPQGPREYHSTTTTAARRWKLVPYDIAASYEDWPALDDLFQRSEPGINHNRGIEGSLIDTDRGELEARMREYFSAMSDDEVRAHSPVLMTDRARYNAAVVRGRARAESAFDLSKLVPYEIFPLDLRTLYYERDFKLLNEAREELGSILYENEFLVTVNEARRTSETRPLLTRCAFDHHLFDVGAQAFPAETRKRVESALDLGEPDFRRLANLSPAVWRVLARSWHLNGTLESADAKSLIRQIFRVVLGVGHSPSFQRDNLGSIAQDWLHIPVPRSREAFEAAVIAGNQVALLLDPLSPGPALNSVLRSLLAGDVPRIAHVGTRDDAAVSEDDFRVTVSYFGAAPGRWIPRMPLATEPWHAEWGETTGDLWLNDRVFIQHVPEAVWHFELGGYPVIKKWLGYREARRRGGKPLTLGEKDDLRAIVQRLAALVVLEPSLDRIYEQAAADAFTAEELGV